MTVVSNDTRIIDSIIAVIDELYKPASAGFVDIVAANCCEAVALKNDGAIRLTNAERIQIKTMSSR